MTLPRRGDGIGAGHWTILVIRIGGDFGQIAVELHNPFVCERKLGRRAGDGPQFKLK